MKLDLKFIRSRRKELNLTLKEMATELSLKHESMYYRYEIGESQIKANMLPIIAEKLNCSIQDLYS